MDTMDSAVSTESSRSHHRQVFWQIVFPLILASSILLALAILLIAGGKSPTRLLADVATIALLLPLLFLALIGILVLGFIIVMLSRLLRSLPPYTQKAQGYAVRGQFMLHRAADLSVRPIFWIKQGQAILQQTTKFLGRKR